MARPERPSRDVYGAALLLVALLLLLCILIGMVVPQMGDQPPVDTASSDHRVDVNSAEAAELQLLPGIGPKLAAAIIESRQSDGPFASLDDLRRVAGIGEQLPLRWAPYIRFGDTTP